MQPDPQGRRGARPLDRVRRRRLGDHEAGAGEDPVAVRDFDGFIDRDIQAEIVGRKDDLPQFAT
jgi:hypothetical protein